MTPPAPVLRRPDPPPWRNAARWADVSRAARRAHPAGDLALWAAGATLFGLIGVVPIVMIALKLSALLVGAPAVAAGMAAVAAGLPDGNGTPEALRVLTETSLDLDAVRTLVLLFPASLYGEGLRRALLQLTPERPDRWTGWQGRLALIVTLVAAPPLMLLLLAAAPVVGPLYAAGGWSLVLGIVIAFHAVFVVVTVALALLYRVVAPGRLPFPVVVAAALATGAVVAGFLQGFVLFLAIPVEWSLPFGGLPVVGAVTALGFWLYLLHVLVLVGYALARGAAEVLAQRRGGESAAATTPFTTP